MTDEEKIALFDRAGITDEFIDETERLIEAGEFFHDSWTTVSGGEPVIVQLRMDPAVVVLLDWRASMRGMTRSEYVTALATA